MKKAVKVIAAIFGIIILGLILQFSVLDEDTDFQTAQAQKSENTDFDKYKKWATNEIKKLKIQISKLKFQLTKSDKTIQDLRTENQHLKSYNADLMDQITYYQNTLASYKQYEKDVEKWAKQVESEYNSKIDSMSQTIQEYENNQKIDATKPKSYISDLKRHWEFTDSKGIWYHWEVPMESYEMLLRYSEPQDLSILNYRKMKLLLFVITLNSLEKAFPK